MKTLIATITLLASTAFAGNTYVNYPAYDGVSVNNLCDAGSEFKTINPVPVCESWTEVPGSPSEGGAAPSDWVCNKWSSAHTTVSKTGKECVKYGTGDSDAATCYEWAPVARKNTVLAEKITAHGDTETIEHFYFTIPACH